MSTPKSFLTSPPNICPKSVKKIARLDSSFAKYTLTFCVLLPTLIVMQVSVVVSFLYDSIHSLHKVSYGGIQCRFKILSLSCLAGSLNVKHKSRSVAFWYIDG